MLVYVVVEKVVYDYSDGTEYISIYGIFADPEAAEAARVDCQAQGSGAKYYAEVQEHGVVESD